MAQETAGAGATRGIQSAGAATGPTSDTAQQKAQSLITRFRGQVDGIFCPNESSTYGMLRALEGAGMLAAQQ